MHTSSIPKKMFPIKFDTRSEVALKVHFNYRDVFQIVCHFSQVSYERSSANQST